MSKSTNPLDAILESDTSKTLSKSERVALWAGQRYYSSVERREARASKAYDKKARKNPGSASLCNVCRKLELSVDDFNGLLKDEWSFGPIGSIRKAEKDARRVLKNLSSQLYEVSGNELNSSYRLRRMGTLHEIRAKATCPFCHLIRQAAEHGVTIGTTAEAIDSAECSVGRLNEIPQCRRNKTKPRRFVRRLVLTFNPSIIEPATLTLMADDAYEPAFLGRILPSPMVDAAMLANWLSMCEGEHKHISKVMDLGYTPNSIAPHFRLIDVDEERIAQKSEPCKYLALSYVWGVSSQTFQSTRANITHLEELGGLKTFEKELPRTIIDAISLVRALGERYLWVDRLCIVQDDLESKMESIQHMDMIYAKSSLTIIAASNTSVHDGLPGFGSTPRHVHQLVENVGPGVRLMLSHGLYTHLSTSVYQSRAWTYQEKCLSPRCLIFTDQQVFFQCQSRVWREDIVEENAEGAASDLYERAFSEQFSDSTVQIMLDGDVMGALNTDPRQENAFVLYTFSIADFTGRHLTYHSDALNAFSGIGKVMALKMKAFLIEGLPNTWFDQAILWRSCKAAQRRSMFPSWSWAGWTGGAGYHNVLSDYGGIEGDRIRPIRKWITWYKRSTDQAAGAATIVASQRQLGINPSRPLEIAWDRSEGSNPYDEHERRPLRWHYKPKALPSQPQLAQTKTCLPARYTLLHFHTLSTYLKLKIWGAQRAGLFDCYGASCGEVVLDNSSNCKDGEVYEFIALSQPAGRASSLDRKAVIDEPIITDRMRPLLRDPSFSSVPPDAPEDGKYWGVSNSDEGFFGQYMTNERQHLLLKYNVMVIEWHGEIAERVGIGEIDATAMDRSCTPGCSWKEIILG